MRLGLEPELRQSRRFTGNTTRIKAAFPPLSTSVVPFAHTNAGQGERSRSRRTVFREFCDSLVHHRLGHHVLMERATGDARDRGVERGDAILWQGAGSYDSGLAAELERALPANQPAGETA